MKAIRIIIWIIVPIVLVLLSIWTINNHINDKVFNEDKAALFDECMSASYIHILEIQESLLITIDVYEDVAYKTEMEHPINFKSAFNSAYYKEMENNPRAMNADMVLSINGAFMGSAVANYLNYGGTLREEESEAFRRFISAWCEIEHPDLDSYESFVERLEVLKGVLNEVMPTMKKSIKSYSNDKNSWREIDPMDKRYIWERYNARKNWPFNFSNN